MRGGEDTLYENGPVPRGEEEEEEGSSGLLGTSELSFPLALL